MARKPAWEVTVGEALLDVVRKSKDPDRVFHYCTITREIERQWPTVLQGVTPELTGNGECWKLVEAGVLKTWKKGSGKFYLADREGEIIGLQRTLTMCWES